MVADYTLDIHSLHTHTFSTHTHTHRRYQEVSSRFESVLCPPCTLINLTFVISGILKGEECANSGRLLCVVSASTVFSGDTSPDKIMIEQRAVSADLHKLDKAADSDTCGASVVGKSQKVIG